MKLVVFPVSPPPRHFLLHNVSPYVLDVRVLYLQIFFFTIGLNAVDWHYCYISVHQFLDLKLILAEFLRIWTHATHYNHQFSS